MMKTFIWILLFQFFAISSFAVFAQTSPPDVQLDSPVCSQELFEKAGNSFNRRKLSSEIRAEQDLKEVILACADYSWRYQAEEYLTIVQEELAEKNFIIGRYYWNRFQEGKMTNLSGVLSRLKTVIEKYPNYSQIILVKQMLDEVNLVKSQMSENPLNQ
ncbi:MAG: hypothetical protein ABI686_12515 [Acidobacteriota bacterium]